LRDFGLDKVTFGAAAGPITVNRYLVDEHAQRAVVLCRYQTPRRVIAGEWANSGWRLTHCGTSAQIRRSFA
jgi:hypothetical protein